MYLSSLASFTYPNTDGTAIAAKIAKITNTTMISTNVKPFFVRFFFVISLIILSSFLFFLLIFCSRTDYLYLLHPKRMKGGGAIKLLFLFLIVNQ